MRTCILFLMLYLIFEQQITVGQFFSLLIYSFFIFGPLQELGNVINIYRETEASLEKFEEIFKIPVDPKPANPVPVDDLRTLEFDGVSFTHQTARAPALADVSFSVERGETVAFVGPSGAGKTTLVKLLVGLYQPRHGPRPVQRRRQRARRPRPVPRAHRLRDAGRAAVLAARSARTCSSCAPTRRTTSASRCCAEPPPTSCSRRADKGLDTVIGEGGMKISGGEKQRLSIARALLRHPHLLVFDEATSSLDSLTEEEISRTMRDISATADVITVLIAHRLVDRHARRPHLTSSSAAASSKSGRHEELLDAQGPLLRDVAPAGRRTAASYPDGDEDPPRATCGQPVTDPPQNSHVNACGNSIGAASASPQTFFNRSRYALRNFATFGAITIWQ